MTVKKGIRQGARRGINYQPVEDKIIKNFAVPKIRVYRYMITICAPHPVSRPRAWERNDMKLLCSLVSIKFKFIVVTTIIMNP